MADRILGVDPGATTGWVVYDTSTRTVLHAGEFRGHAIEDFGCRFDLAVIERPMAYGPTRPEVVDAAYVCGRLVAELEQYATVHELTRLDVKKVLTAATLREIQVKNDATAWAALVLLHGEGCDAKPRTKNGQVVSPGGALGLVTGHARAALAVAVAFALRQSQTTGGVHQ